MKHVRVAWVGLLAAFLVGCGESENLDRGDLSPALASAFSRLEREGFRPQVSRVAPFKEPIIAIAEDTDEAVAVMERRKPAELGLSPAGSGFSRPGKRGGSSSYGEICDRYMIEGAYRGPVHRVANALCGNRRP